MIFKNIAQTIKYLRPKLIKNVFLSNFSKTAHNPETRYKIHILPALTDNYMYLLIDKHLNTAIAVDPVEPEHVMSVVTKENAKLSAVLTTHHHYDHAGGNLILSQLIPNLPIYGLDERINALTVKVLHNQVVKLGDLEIKCLHTPCHTSGHVCYYIHDSILGPTCFTGDTLFVAGCGKFFEGSASDMTESLKCLSSLPQDTKCYCGHEYTLNNLKFAKMIEPDNQAIDEKIQQVKQMLGQKKPSVPTTIKDEMRHNPFLRLSCPSVQKYVGETELYAVMSALRKLKDTFKG